MRQMYTPSDNEIRFTHTKSSKHYFFRLFMFALLSEIPYDLAFGGQWFDSSRQNIFFTLLAGLSALMVIDSNKISSDVKILLIVALVTAANLFHFDYYYLGVLQVVCFYVFRTNVLKQFLTVGILNLFYMFRISTQSAAILGLLPIYLYNGERDKKTGIVFYIFYPAHLFIFWIIKRYFVG
ncbi:TraX family protein [Sphingobacterium cavernae]|uniref:TraX family protein n=1 Tax=Sphingobacterium cavernae TaxID=2592657 RepID=UPI0012300D03|nr:TraX family protein [Sphingobacterium cavernae]